MRTCCRGGRLLAVILCLTAVLTSRAAFAGEDEQQMDMTLVTGTRFVTPATGDTTAKARFTDDRIPISAFNETDHCIDQRALEVATTYFDTFGRELAKAGHYYFVPRSDSEVHAAACTAQFGQSPQAWVAGKTDIIAFGRVVPTAMADEVERGVR